MCVTECVCTPEPTDRDPTLRVVTKDEFYVAMGPLNVQLDVYRAGDLGYCTDFTLKYPRHLIGMITNQCQLSTPQRYFLSQGRPRWP